MNKDSGNASSTARRGRNWLIYGLFGLMLTLGLLAVLIPTILSTSLGRGVVVGAINDTVRGSVAIDALSLSWLGGQSIHGVEILDPTGRTVARLEEASTELTLLQAIQRNLSLGRTTVRGLSAELIVDESGVNNLTEALEPKTPSARGTIPVLIPLTGNIELTDARMTVTTPYAQPALFEGLTGAMQIESAERALNIGLQGRSRQGDKTGEFKITGRVTDLIAPDGTLSLQTATGNLEANIKDLPIDSVDGMLGLQGLLSAAAGESASLNIQVSGTAQMQNLLITAYSPNIQAEITAEVNEDRFALTQPVSAHFNVTPSFFQALTQTDGGEAAPRLVEAFPLNLKAETLDLSITDFNLADVALHGSVVVNTPIQLTAGELGEVTIRSLNAAVDSERVAETISIKLDGEAVSQNKPGKFDVQATLDQVINRQGALQLDKIRADVMAKLTSIPTLLIDQIARQNGQLVNLLGPKVDFSARVESSGSDRIDGTLSVDAGPLTAKDVTLSLTDSLVLTKPTEIHYLMSPEVVRRVLGEDLGFGLPNRATLGKPMPVEITLSRLDLPLAAPSMMGMQAKATLHFDELILAGDKSVAGASLQNADVAVDYDGPSGSATIRLTANTMLPGDQEAGILKIDATANRLVRNGELSLRTADVNAKVNIDSLPTALLAAVSGQKAVVPIVGDFMKVDMAVDLIGDKESGMIELKTQSPNLVLEAGFNLGDELVLSRPASLRFTLTPGGYKALLDAPSTSSETGGTTPGYELSEDATFEAVVATLRWPLSAADGKKQFNPSRAAMVATAATPRFSLRDRASGHTFYIEMFKVMLQGSDLSKPIDIELEGQIRDAESDQGQPAAGHLGVLGQVSDVFTADGQFNSDGLSIRLGSQLRKLPMALLDQMLYMDGLTVAAFGATADITLDMDLQRMVGPLNLQLRSASSTVDIKAQIHNGGLVLTEPLVAEAQVTQATGKLILGKIHPIFETAQSSERAVRLEVPREGVLIPIRDYDIGKIIIPWMKLDLGTLTLKSGWLLKGTIGLAQQFGELKDSGRDQWTAIFTPVILQMRGGKLTYERRLDLLLDERLHLTTWGTADIANDRVDLTLAFMPETLEKVFGLTVAPGDALRIPVRGTLNEPNVDFGKAGLELGRLQAQKQLAEKDKLVGALVGVVAARAIDGTPMPPASVDPLPWGPLPMPEGRVEAQKTKDPVQPPKTTEPKSIEEQAIEGLFDLLRKKKE